MKFSDDSKKLFDDNNAEIFHQVHVHHQEEKESGYQNHKDSSAVEDSSKPIIASYHKPLGLPLANPRTFGDTEGEATDSDDSGSDTSEYTSTEESAGTTKHISPDKSRQAHTKSKYPPAGTGLRPKITVPSAAMKSSHESKADSGSFVMEPKLHKSPKSADLSDSKPSSESTKVPSDMSSGIFSPTETAVSHHHKNGPSIAQLSKETVTSLIESPSVGHKSRHIGLIEEPAESAIVSFHGDASPYATITESELGHEFKPNTMMNLLKHRGSIPDSFFKKLIKSKHKNPVLSPSVRDQSSASLLKVQVPSHGGISAKTSAEIVSPKLQGHETVTGVSMAAIVPPALIRHKMVDVAAAKKGFGKLPIKPKSYLIKELQDKLQYLTLRHSLLKYRRLHHKHVNGTGKSIVPLSNDPNYVVMHAGAPNVDVPSSNNHLVPSNSSSLALASLDTSTKPEADVTPSRKDTDSTGEVSENDKSRHSSEDSSGSVIVPDILGLRANQDSTSVQSTVPADTNAAILPLFTCDFQAPFLCIMLYRSVFVF